MNKREMEKLFKRRYCAWLLMPKSKGEYLWAPTHRVAEVLEVSTRTITEYVRLGMPKEDRDLFYLPDAINFAVAKSIADALRCEIHEVARGCIVDFSLGQQAFQPDTWDIARAYIEYGEKRSQREESEERTPSRK